MLVAACAWLGGAEVAPRTTWLWRVEGGSAPLALLGSMHVGDARLYPLPMPVEQAIASAEVIALEDASSTYTPEENARLAAVVAAPAGDLWRALPPEIAGRCGQRCDALEVAREQLAGVRPAIAAVVLGMVAAQRASLSPAAGVDHYVAGRIDGRDVVRLEPIDDALQRFAAIDPAVEARLLDASLPDADPQRVTALYEAYRRGDLAGVRALVDGFGAGLAEADRAAVRQAALIDRNRAMARVLEEQLRGQRRCLAVVGVAHLLGPESLVALLRADGFSVVGDGEAP